MHAYIYMHVYIYMHAYIYMHVYMYMHVFIHHTCIHSICTNPRSETRSSPQVGASGCDSTDGKRSNPISSLDDERPVSARGEKKLTNARALCACVCVSGVRMRIWCVCVCVCVCVRACVRACLHLVYACV